MVSIITAHFPGRESFLIETYASILQQDVEWEWLIQVDGQENIPEQIKNNPRVKIKLNNMRLTPAITRNLALARANGEFVYSLDDDDLLLPNALQYYVTHLTANPDIYCSFGKSYKLINGEKTDWISHGIRQDSIYQPGRIPQGKIIEVWMNGQSHYIPSTALFWRKEALLKIGSYPAMFGSDDTAILLLANLESDVLFIEEDTFIHRIHQKQTTHTENYRELRLTNRILLTEILKAKGVDIPKQVASWE